MDNKQEINVAALKIVGAVYETVVEMGSEGAPEGPIYQALMERGCTLSTFEKIVGLLVDSGMVRRENHVLYAIGEKK